MTATERATRSAGTLLSLSDSIIMGTPHAWGVLYESAQDHVHGSNEEEVLKQLVAVKTR